MDQPDISTIMFPSDRETPEISADNIDIAESVRDSRPTALLIADRMSSSAALVEAANMRLLGRISCDAAMAHLDDLAQVDLVLLECAAPHPMFGPLLTRLNHMAIERDACVVIACSLDVIDQAFGLVTADGAHLLCDPDPLDLATSLALALRDRRRDAMLWDIGRESESARLERLSAEVGRLARVLDSLVRVESGTAPTAFASPPRMADRASAYIGEAASPIGFARPMPTLDQAQIRDLLRARRQRDQFLPADLFADPAWDMMLDLLAARLSGGRVSVSSLCIAAAVPPTTALRWIRQLTDRGLFIRQADPADGRRIFIALSDEAAGAITRWFAVARSTLRDTFA